jgi:drug/metabolite transporter (DMT)-like permease
MDIALEHQSPFSILTYRCLLALPFLFLWKGKEQWRGLNRSSFQAGFLTGLAIFFAFSLQISALQWTTTTNVSLLTGLYIVIVPILATWLLKDKIQPTTIAGVVVCTMAVFVMAGDLSTWNGFGDFVTICSTFFIAIQVIAVQAWTTRHSPYLIATIQIAVMGLLGLLCALLWESPLDLPKSSIFWICIGGSAVFATFICFVIQATMQRKTTATKATMIYLSEPVWGAFFANWIQGEALTTKVLLGGLILLTGMIISEYPNLRGAVVRLTLKSKNQS